MNASIFNGKRSSPYSALDFSIFASIVLGFLSCLIFIGPMLMKGEAPGDLGDARFNTFVLEHVYLFLTGHVRHFASAPILYPFPDTFFFADTLIGSEPFYAVFRALGWSELHAFALWFFTGNLVTFVAAHFALKRFGLIDIAAIVAAALFTFGLPEQAQYGHAQLACRCGVPLALLFLWQGLTLASLRKLSIASIWLCFQILISVYIGVFLALLMAAFAAAYIIITWPAFKSRWRTRFMNEQPSPFRDFTFADYALMCLSAALLAATFWLSTQYARVAAIYGLRRNWLEISSMLPRPSSYLMMDSLPYWANLHLPLDYVPMWWEQQLFIGAGATGLFLVGCGRLAFGRAAGEDRSLTCSFLAAIVLLVLLTLDVNSHSFYQILANLPGFNAIRSVSRIILVLLFPIAFIAGYGLTALLRELRPKPLGLGSGVMLVLLTIGEMNFNGKSSFAIANAQQRIERLVNRAETNGQGVSKPILAVLTPSHPDDAIVHTHLDAMLATQRLGWPTVNGYVGNNVPGEAFIVQCKNIAAQYFAFASWRERDRSQPESVASLLRRTIVVDELGGNARPCDFRALPERAFQLPSEGVPKQIELTSGPMEKTKTGLRFTVTIKNRGPEPIAFLAPVRLSWRFVPATQNNLPATRGWDNRRDLSAEIPASGRETDVMEAPLPTKQGRYRLEVTLVLEWHYWFQDKGMKILAFKEPIVVN